MRLQEGALARIDKNNEVKKVEAQASIQQQALKPNASKIMFMLQPKTPGDYIYIYLHSSNKNECKSISFSFFISLLKNFVEDNSTVTIFQILIKFDLEI